MRVTTRPVGESFQRALKLTFANPFLAVVQVAFSGVVFVSGVLALVLLALALLPVVAGLVGAGGGLPPALARLLGQESLPAPSLALVGLAVLVALLLGTFVLAAAAWVRGGILAILVEADASAPERAPLASFRLRRPGAFLDGARRLFWRFFALVNLALTAGLLVAIVAVLGVLVFAFSMTRENVMAGVVVLVACVLVAVVLAVLLRLATLSCERAIAAHDLPLLDGIGAGLRQLAGSFGPSFLLLLLLIAASSAVSLLFAAPRLVVQMSMMGSDRLAVPLLGVLGIFLLIEMAAYAVMEVVNTSAFVVLWGFPTHPPAPSFVRFPAAPAPAGPPAPPVAFVNALVPAPSPSRPAEPDEPAAPRHEGAPAPETPDTE